MHHGLKTLIRTKIFYPFRESNPGHQVRSLLLYQSAIQDLDTENNIFSVAIKSRSGLLIQITGVLSSHSNIKHVINEIQMYPL
jgi:hypothetical protein